MPNNNLYLYTVYRNSDDALLALDVTGQEASRIMGMQKASFYRFMAVSGGRNGAWTVIKTAIADIQADTKP